VAAAARRRCCNQLPGFCLASAMKSWSVFTGTLAGETSMLSPVTSDAIRENDLIGS